VAPIDAANSYLSSPQTSLPDSPILDSPANGSSAFQARAAANARSKLAKDRIAKVPRPPNAFILYRQHHHPIVKKQNPNIHNNQICESFSQVSCRSHANSFAAVIIGNMWKNEDDAIKATYKNKAEEVKRMHVEAHPEYQYQPRKPSDKKRRMTRRKAARLATSAAQKSPTQSVGNLQLSNLSTTASPNSTSAPGDESDTVAAALQMASATIDPLLTQYTLPEEIPDFETFGNGDYLIHNYSAQQPGLFEHMIDKHNEYLAAQNAPVSANIQPQVLLSGLGLDNANETVADRSFIDFPKLDAQAQAIQDKIIAELDAEEAIRESLDPRPYETEAAYHAQWMEWNLASELRMEQLENEVRNLPKFFGDLTHATQAGDAQTVSMSQVENGAATHNQPSVGQAQQQVTGNIQHQSSDFHGSGLDVQYSTDYFDDSFWDNDI